MTRPPPMSATTLTAAATASTVALLALLWWPSIPLGLAVAVVFQRVRPALLNRQRQRRMAEALGEVTDLMAIAVSSGVTIIGSITLLAERGPPTVRHGFVRAVEHLEAGGGTTDALHRAAEELGVEYRSLMVTLAQAEREGSPLGALLIRLTDEASDARRRRAELAARQLPVQMLLPLVFCSLPAVVLGAVVPLVIVSLRRL